MLAADAVLMGIAAVFCRLAGRLAGPVACFDKAGFDGRHREAAGAARGSCGSPRHSADDLIDVHGPVHVLAVGMIDSYQVTISEQQKSGPNMCGRAGSMHAEQRARVGNVRCCAAEQINQVRAQQHWASATVGCCGRVSCGTVCGDAGALFPASVRTLFVRTLVASPFPTPWQVLCANLSTYHDYSADTRDQSTALSSDLSRGAGGSGWEGC